MKDNACRYQLKAAANIVTKTLLCRPAAILERPSPYINENNYYGQTLLNETVQVIFLYIIQYNKTLPVNIEKLYMRKCTRF